MTADATVVAVNGKVFAKLPFTTKFAPIDPGDYSAPDPAALLEPKGGLSSLLTSARAVQKGKQVRDGKVVVTSYTADVPGKAVASVIPSADAGATFSGIFAVTDDPLIVFAANAFALVGLRALYVLLADLLVRFVYLDLALAAILGFVAITLLMNSALGRLNCCHSSRNL